MLAGFRSFAKSPFAIALIFVLMLAFLLVGTTDMFANLLSGGTGSNVVKAGSREVTQPEFNSEFRRQLRAMSQQYGRPISTEMAIEQGFDRRMLTEKLRTEAMSELLRRLGIRSPKKVLQEELRRNPRFFDPLTGEFSQEQYQSALAELEATPAMYEKDMSDRLAAMQVVPALSDGLKAPLAYAALGGALRLEQRDLAYFVVTPQSVGPQPAPTEAEIQAFVKANASRLTLPEFRGITVVRLSRKAFEPAVTVDPAEVQRRFDFEKDSLSKAETRSVVQIPVKDAAQGAAIVAEINKGADPRVVAGRLGIKPILYENKPRSAFFDPTIAARAFALPQGGVETVKGSLGLVVLKVETVAAGQAATLDQHRPAIEAKVRAVAADRKVSEAAKIYEDARAAGDDLPTAAKKAGLQIVTYAPVSAQGAGRDDKPVAGLTPAIVGPAFQTGQGRETEILQDGDGEYFIVHVDSIIPPALRPMEQLRPRVAQELARRKMQEAIRARVAILEARVRKGEPLAAVAASAGLKVETLNGVSHTTAEAHRDLGELLAATFRAKKGDIFSAGTKGGIAVGTLTGLRGGDVRAVAVEARQQQAPFSQQLFQDIGGSFQRYSVVKTKAKSSFPNARAAIGGPAPEAATKSKDK